MPKIITSVNWSAQNVPSGLSFDPQTGSFSGTPVGTGEYTIPVTVQTNYGEDTKDVIINVKSGTPEYNVYSIGENALLWSNNAKPDELGFYGLSIPKAYKLVQHHRGFGAKAQDGRYYYCGVRIATSTSAYSHSSSSSTFNSFAINKDPTENSIEGLEETQAGLAQRKQGTGATNSGVAYYSELFYFVKRFSDGSLELTNSLTHYYLNNATTSFDSWSDSSKSYRKEYQGGYFKLEENAFGFINADDKRGIPVLNNNGTYESTISFLNSFSSASYYAGDLGFSAIKRFSSVPLSLYNGTASTANNQMSLQPPVFTYLTKDKLLDNDEHNFTLGVIRDAWVMGTTAYVVTEDNKLYLYDDLLSIWNFVGNYDVKKIEFPIIYSNFIDLKSKCGSLPNIVFMLTNDGKLYHKGADISDIADEHAELTQIFPECYFHDFTFGGNTLTVLKE